jgi:DNA-binding response OmpR family regulator
VAYHVDSGAYSLIFFGVMRILVIEDETDTAETLKILLSFDGDDVEIARDGVTALIAAQTKPPDVVILDIGIPGMNGWEVASRLRQMTFARTPTVIAASGYGQEKDRKRSHEAGVDFHFVKPTDPAVAQKLLSSLRNVHVAG